MPVSELIMKGLELMVLGMGIVFTFLILLVFTMKGMSRMALSLDQGEPQTTSPSMPPATTTGNAESDEQLIAVISAAINRFRGTPR